MTSTPVVFGKRPPLRPQGEVARARRTAILAFGFFLAATVHLAVVGVDLGTLQHGFPLYALGGFSILIFGTMRLLISGMAGREIAGAGASSLAVTSLAAVGASGLFVFGKSSPAVVIAFASLWGLAALGHSIVTLLTVRSAPARPPIRDPAATPASRVPVRILEAGSLVYSLASAVMVPLAYAGGFGLASAIHLVLVGFVIVTIMSVAVHILPRFTGVRAPTWLLWALTPFALVGPALVAMALHRHRSALAMGAAFEGVAFALFASLMFLLLARSRRPRWHHAAYAGAPLAIGIGGLIALMFAWRGSFTAHLATHGLLNVFGFVGLFVIAASTDLYAPAMGAGAAPAKKHAAIASSGALVGLVVAAVGSWVGSDAAARLGMVLYAGAIAWQLIGIIFAHRRAGRVVSKFRAS